MVWARGSIKLLKFVGQQESHIDVTSIRFKVDTHRHFAQSMFKPNRFYRILPDHCSKVEGKQNTKDAKASHTHNNPNYYWAWVSRVVRPPIKTWQQNSKSFWSGSRRVSEDQYHLKSTRLPRRFYTRICICAGARTCKQLDRSSKHFASINLQEWREWRTEIYHDLPWFWVLLSFFPPLVVAYVGRLKKGRESGAVAL